MIGPAEVAARAARWWPKVLRAHLTGEIIFPREVPRIGKITSRTSLADFDRIGAEQRALVAAAAGKFSLHWQEVATRALGSNRFITHISVDDLTSYLRLTGKSEAYETFKKLWARTQVQCPIVMPWITTNPEKLLEYSDVWSDLLKVVTYFNEKHVRDEFYIRELPISVPTKFVESHRAILAELLDATLPPESIDDRYRGVNSFDARYGLLGREPLVRMRLLDRSMAEVWFSGVDDVSMPLPQFRALHLRPRRVIILENKTNYGSMMNFLTLPDCEGTVAIFGSGFAVGKLQRVEWLRETELLYWGDLDAAGFQIVNQLRGYFPNLQTFLMDKATLNALPDYHVDAPKSPVARLEYLTQQELALYDYLNSAGLRLEQERVPLVMVRRALTADS